MSALFPESRRWRSSGVRGRRASILRPHVRKQEHIADGGTSFVARTRAGGPDSGARCADVGAVPGVAPLALVRATRTRASILRPHVRKQDHIADRRNSLEARTRAGWPDSGVRCADVGVVPGVAPMALVRATRRSRDVHAFTTSHLHVFTRAPKGAPQSSGRICGNRITSRMLGLSVSNMTRRSMPMPSPAVGGRPYSRARM